jgi:hypothetical protein
MTRMRWLLCALVAAAMPCLGCGIFGHHWHVSWQREIHADGFDQVDASGMAASPDGGVIVAAMTAKRRAPSEGALVLRLGACGKVRNLRRYGHVTFPHVSVLYDGEPRSVCAVASGGYIACGCDSGRALLLRLDENGDTLWTRSFLDSAALARFWTVTATSDGGFAAVGHFYVREGSESYALIRTDSAGNELWHRRIDSGLFVKMPWGLCEEPDRGFLISADDCWFIRTDESGNTLWAHQRPYGLTSHLCPAPSGGCYAAGGWSDSTRDSWHVVTFWLNSNGGVLRASSYRKGLSVSASDIAATPDGGWVVFGTVMPSC